MPKKNQLVQVSPKEMIRKKPGETAAQTKARWKAEQKKQADKSARGTRNIQRQQNLDRMVGTPNRKKKS